MLKRLFIFTITLLLIVYVDFIFDFNSKIVVLFLFLVSFYFYKDKSIQKNDFFFKKSDIILFIIAIIAISVYIISYNLIISNLVISSSSNIEIKPVIYNLVLIIFMSVFEEIIFRGYFLKELLNSENKIKAIFFTSLYFSLAHFFTDSGLLYVFLISLIISIVFLYTRSILISILLHLYSNFFVLFLLNKFIN